MLSVSPLTQPSGQEELLCSRADEKGLVTPCKHVLGPDAASQSRESEDVGETPPPQDAGRLLGLLGEEVASI